jgi:hypothetical protein
MPAEWDVFISHASEDKEAVARPLTQLLQQAGLRVWLDENELTVGDSLSRKIDEGLARSSYGVVILSRQFFQKGWPTHELAGLTARQIGARKVILPVWHGVDREFVLSISPPLADALAVKTNLGLDRVAEEIARAIRAPLLPAPPIAPARRPLWRRNGVVFSAICLLLALAFGISFYLIASRKKVQATENLDINQPLLWRSHHTHISGYFAVSCNTCPRPRAWAFYVPPSDGIIKMAQTHDTTLWPSMEFLYPEDKPTVSACVDFPKGVCPADLSIWKPTHPSPANAKPHGPRLRLDLHLIISGFELHVANEGDVLAQGINVDVMGWQAGAPGAEFIKSYPVRDLGPLADDTIQFVFGTPFAEPASSH